MLLDKGAKVDHTDDNFRKALVTYFAELMTATGMSNLIFKKGSNKGTLTEIEEAERMQRAVGEAVQAVRQPGHSGRLGGNRGETVKRTARNRHARGWALA